MRMRQEKIKEKEGHKIKERYKINHHSNKNHNTIYSSSSTVLSN